MPRRAVPCRPSRAASAVPCHLSHCGATPGRVGPCRAMKAIVVPCRAALAVPCCAMRAVVVPCRAALCRVNRRGAVPCCTAPCHALPCRPCCGMLCHASHCGATLCRAAPCRANRAALRHAIHATLRHALPRHACLATLRRDDGATRCHAVPRRAVPCQPRCAPPRHPRHAVPRFATPRVPRHVASRRRCHAVPRGAVPRRADGAPRPCPAASGRCGRRARQRVQVLRALRSDPVGLEGLRAAALGEGGLCPELRPQVWPRLLSVDPCDLPPRPAPPALQDHRDRGQVLLDVARSTPRFPPGMPAEQRRVLQEQLAGLILHVLRAHPQLHYYQGYHDVALTLLLVLGQRRAAPLLEQLSTHHLRDFMDPTMDSTKHILNYLMPLLQRESPRLHDFMQRAEVGTVFALSWLITWYGHVLTDFHHTLRLFDFFLASHPLMPVYFAAAVVLHREEEVLGAPCDMPSLHQLLSRIPPDLPYERLVSRAQELFQRHPHARLSRQHHKSIAIQSFGAFQRAASCQRPDAVLRRQRREPAGTGGDAAIPLPAAGRNPLVKVAVWGLSATLGAVALAVTHTALDWGPEFLLRLF